MYAEIPGWTPDFPRWSMWFKCIDRTLLTSSLKLPWHLHEFRSRTATQCVVPMSKVFVNEREECVKCAGQCGGACHVVERISKCSKIWHALIFAPCACTRVNHAWTLRELGANTAYMRECGANLREHNVNSSWTMRGMACSVRVVLGVKRQAMHIACHQAGQAWPKRLHACANYACRAWHCGTMRYIMRDLYFNLCVNK